MNLHLSFCLILLTLLCGCSPSPDQAPKIAEESRAALDKAKSVAADSEKTAEEAKQNIDEQTQ